MNEFFQGLKQRKLVQWAVAYIAAAFALLQGFDIVANRFDLPSQTVRLVMLTMIVGFFVTLVRHRNVLQLSRGPLRGDPRFEKILASLAPK